MTLEEITAVTKIRKDYLRAIEAGEFSRLPGGLFPRAFLRTYARQVGLDADKVVADYVELTAPAEAAAGGRAGAPLGVAAPAARQGAITRGAGPSRAPAQAMRGKSGGGWISIGIAVVVIAGIVYWGQTRRQETAQHPRARRTESSSSTAQQRREREGRLAAARRRGAKGQARGLAGGTAAAGAAAAPARAVTRQASSVAPGTSIAKASAPKPPVAPIQVGITATAAAWIHLTAAGKTIAQTTLQPGQSASYAVTPPVDLISGNAGGTQVTVNGAPQPALGAAGVIVLWRYPPGTVRLLPPAKPAATQAPPAKASPAAKKPAPAKAVGGAPDTGSGQP